MKSLMSGDPRTQLTYLASTSAQLYRGERIALLVITGYLVFVGFSAATAPPVDIGRTDTESETLVGIQGPFREANGYAVVLGPRGTTQWRSPEAWAHFDVDRLPNEQILAGVMVRNQAKCGQFVPPCARTGFRIYDPASPAPIVRQWTFPVRSHVNSEAHDATVLPDGTIAVSDMEHERVAVVNQTGATVWQWNASSYYEAPADPTRTDWLHINDVDYLGDDQFLVSVRNANQLVIVKRGTGVISVINRDDTDTNDASCQKRGQLRDTGGDGDVQCGDPAVLDHQHNPQYLGPTRILVADSGNDRVVELRKTEAGSWSVAWQLHSAGGVPFNWPRDADLLPNGNLLITDTFNNRVLEVTRNGTVVWSTSTRPIPYEADRNGTEYPSTLPNATADPDARRQGAETGGSIPLLSAAYVGFVGTASPPYWFQLSHFLGLVVATLAGLGGITSSLLNRSR